jgi:hypothetical protein
MVESIDNSANLSKTLTERNRQDEDLKTEIISEEYEVWKKNAPFFYDTLFS